MTGKQNMDRSYLTNEKVVEASRDFVCVRLATYEDEAEGEFLESVFRGRSGELENSVFALLAPDGKTKLTRAGRSPHMVFRARSEEESVEQMVEKMREIAKRYPGKGWKAQLEIPYLADLRRGLNVASCDLQLLVVVAAKSESEKRKLEKALLPLAWDDEFQGQFAYANVSKLAELKAISGAAKKSSVIVVEPDAYGMTGKAIAQLDGKDVEALGAAMAKALEEYAPAAKDSRSHIRKGHKQGVHWETEIPVTDPHAPSEHRRGR